MDYAIGSPNALATLEPDRSSRASIVFYKCSREHSREQIINAIAHEVAHSNDWNLDNEMTHKERVDLLLKIFERVNSEDRFMSSYVEGIVDSDKKREAFLKVREYWAVICAQYFSDASKLNIKDAELIEGHIKRTDPEFNWGEKATRRLNLAYGNN